MQIHVGTSGYSYADWKGRFYPERVRPVDMLAFYAERFDTVELNVSFYRQPEPAQLEAMAARAAAVNPAFTFALKANRALTHEIAPAWPDEARRFTDAAGVLQAQGRLGAVLVQFPYSFGYAVPNRRHLDALLQALAPLPLACEFRNARWLQPRVYEGLRARGVGLVAVDEPQLPGLLPPVVQDMGPCGYVRFHGRNATNWWGGDNASRYDYLYPETELREWVPRLEGFSEAKSVYVYFNNHWNAQATENARAFRELLLAAGNGESF